MEFAKDPVDLDGESFDAGTRGGIVVAVFYRGSRGQGPAALLSEARQRCYKDDVRLVSLDADMYPDIPAKHGAKIFPAALFMRNGVVKKVLQPVNDPAALADEIEANACYRCCITRSRSEARTRGRSGRRR